MAGNLDWSERGRKQRWRADGNVTGHGSSLVGKWPLNERKGYILWSRLGKGNALANEASLPVLSRATNDDGHAID